MKWFVDGEIGNTGEYFTDYHTVPEALIVTIKAKRGIKAKKSLRNGPIDPGAVMVSSIHILN